MHLNQLSRVLYEIRSTQKTNIYIYILLVNIITIIIIIIVIFISCYEF